MGLQHIYFSNLIPHCRSGSNTNILPTHVDCWFKLGWIGQILTANSTAKLNWAHASLYWILCSSFWWTRFCLCFVDGRYWKDCGTFSYTNVYYQRIILGEVLWCGSDISGCVNLKFIEGILKVEYRVDIYPT